MILAAALFLLAGGGAEPPKSLPSIATISPSRLAARERARIAHLDRSMSSKVNALRDEAPGDPNLRWGIVRERSAQRSAMAELTYAQVAEKRHIKAVADVDSLLLAIGTDWKTIVDDYIDSKIASDPWSSRPLLMSAAISCERPSHAVPRWFQFTPFPVDDSAYYVFAPIAKTTNTSQECIARNNESNRGAVTVAAKDLDARNRQLADLIRDRAHFGSPIVLDHLTKYRDPAQYEDDLAQANAELAIATNRSCANVPARPGDESALGKSIRANCEAKLSRAIRSRKLIIANVERMMRFEIYEIGKAS